MTRYDWIGKVIHVKLCKKLKFEYNTKLYRHKQESVWENVTNKILWDFAVETNHLIPPSRQNIVMINNKKEKLQYCQLGRLGATEWKSNKYKETST